LTSLVAPSFSFIVQLQAMPNTLLRLPCFLTFVLIVKQDMKPKKNKKKETNRKIEKNKKIYILYSD
jgi:hypothetical protein